jgi:hypothetical protein
MTVSIDQVTPGAVFRFKTAARRVVNVTIDATAPSGYVEWEYADGKKRHGKQFGSMGLQSFCKDAVEEILRHTSIRKIKSSNRKIPCAPELVDITVQTRCPDKWVMVDLETGELWGHDGDKFVRLDAVRAVEASAVVAQAVARQQIK